VLAYALSLALAAQPGGAGSGTAASADAGSPTASQVVLALLERQRQAWNAGDLEGFCAIYADDARFLSPSGVTQGRAAVLARYQQRYPNKSAMGTLAFDVLEVREAGGAVSIAARWILSFPGKPPASGHTLIVFNLLPAGWRLVQDASM
jgi:uncharacterized protein (TIGR02246 family)